MFGIRIQYADAVVTAVAVSSVVTALCGMVIAANVYDALHGVVATPERVEEAAVAPEAGSAAIPWPRRRSTLPFPLGFEDARPALGAAPERGTGELLLARLPQVHGPLSPETRGALNRPLRRF
jgi:hypothetical protein